LKRQIAELNAQKVKYEELYNSLKKENARNEAELKQSKLMNNQNQIIEDQNTNNITKALDQISTLKAKLLAL
jgi:benzoyl-CoA reductase/2-hydroxyglutaryl-CoA dehydratase subunit BcrC/BadD/HgdB